MYVADRNNNRIQYFTRSGSFLGKWGSPGSGNGQFNWPHGVAITANGNRIYVADYNNHRIQYFRWSPAAVVPSSVGRIKALFK
jgi:DNA-binding beta-propeller fold protein YncE